MRFFSSLVGEEGSWIQGVRGPSAYFSGYFFVLLKQTKQPYILIKLKDSYDVEFLVGLVPKGLLTHNNKLVYKCFKLH